MITAQATTLWTKTGNVYQSNLATLKPTNVHGNYPMPELGWIFPFNGFTMRFDDRGKFSHWQYNAPNEKTYIIYP